MLAHAVLRPRCTPPSHLSNAGNDVAASAETPWATVAVTRVASSARCPSVSRRCPRGWPYAGHPRTPLGSNSASQRFATGRRARARGPSWTSVSRESERSFLIPVTKTAFFPPEWLTIRYSAI